MISAVWYLTLPPTVLGQVAPLLARGRAAITHLDPAGAARAFDAVLAKDSLNFEALWRGSLTLVDIGKQVPDTIRSRFRDSVYLRAVDYARRAVAVDSLSAQGYFALANALGKATLTRSKNVQMRDAKAIRTAALTALARDPNHDGAHHILGRWHAEIMRLPGVLRFLARHVMGESLFAEASWDEAISHLEAAVASRPDWIYHRLDLGLIYVDRKRYQDAQAQFRVLDTLPIVDVLDTLYRRQARTVVETIRNR